MDESTLIGRIRAGEKSLFLDLIRPHERSIYLIAYSVLKNEADAEETAQETILKAFQHLDQLRSNTSFKSWLLHIAMNEARMRRRKGRAHLYESLDEGIQESDGGEVMPRQIADWREIPSEALDRKELREQLSAALYDLPENYREVFLLRDVQHLKREGGRRDPGHQRGCGQDPASSSPSATAREVNADFQEEVARSFALPEGRKAMVSCQHVLKELSNYIDDSISAELRQQIESHLRMCSRCSVVLDTTKKTIRIYGDECVLDVPVGYNDRLREFFLKSVGA